MAAWTICRRFATAITVVVVLGSFAVAGESDSVPAIGLRPDTASLRTRADAAEKTGDWETAFGLYCHLYIADRTAPDVREKLNNALRRVQQIRRHREPGFQNFTTTLKYSDALNLYADVMLQVPRAFADAERSLPQSLWASGVEELDRALGNSLFQQMYLEQPTPERIEAMRSVLRNDWAKRPIRNADEARWQLRELVSVAQDRCPFRVKSAIVLEFVCGACTGLDEYSVYLNPGSATADLMNAAPDLSDYGIYLTYQDGEVLIDGIAPGSWAAYHTSLRKCDRITRINGQSLHMGGPAAVADALRHPIGMIHEFDVMPVEESSPGVVQLPLAAPTVFAAQILNPKEGVGYLRVGSIRPDTPRELDLAICELRNRGMRVLVLDLRGNHGGNFLAGIAVAKQFIPHGIIVSTQGQVGDVANRVFSSDSGMSAFDMPIVALVDTETASAAEVIVAALKDHNRAVLVGMPTFGKGAMQYPLKLTALDSTSNPGVKSGTVKLTIAKLVSPNGKPINGVGITPDYLETDPACQEEVAVQRALELLRMPMRPVRE